MPLFGWGKSQQVKNASSKTDFKAKLEHKLLQAKQTPEPIFDLSDCGLKEVPVGVYSWCKVCLKEALLLQDNALTSLSEGGNLKDLAQLQILDLRNNEFSKLPSDIDNLVNLQILYLDNNRLTSLPQSFKCLVNLKTIVLRGNKFKEFPEILCELRQLRTIDISNNAVTKLPPSLAFVRTLDTLVLDVNNMQFPLADICSEGLEAIMQCLCKESEIEYVPPSKAIAALSTGKRTSSNSSSPDENAHEELEDKLKDYWQQLENKKEKKRQDMLAVERTIKEQQLDQASVIASIQLQRLKLLDDVSKGQNQLEEELLRAQLKKDKARQYLVAELVQVEQESNQVIEELLAMAERAHNVEAILEAEKQERKEFEELFLKRQEEEQLSHKEVLSAMALMLESEEVLLFHGAMRAESKKRLQQESDEATNLLEQVLDKKSQEQTEIIAKLLSEEQFQKEALIALMNRKDSESIFIRDQLALVQDELAKLTMLELKQRDLKIDFQQQVLGQKREILTQLLMQLLEQQKLRREEMNRRLHEMEEVRLTSQQDYWLIQYQRLMAHKPASVTEMEAKMDPSVKAFLNKAGLPEYTSLFARKQISYVQLCTMGKEDLKEIGLFNPFVINTILSTLEAIRREERTDKIMDAEPSTSAIPSAPSITTHTEVECVICMEKPCTMLFLHCGHVCCCQICSVGLTTCPMCRGQIVQSFELKFME